MWALTARVGSMHDRHRQLHLTSAFDGHPQFAELIAHIRAEDAAAAPAGSRRTRTAMRHDPLGPTLEERERDRRGRERLTRTLAWCAIAAAVVTFAAPWLERWL